MVPVEALVLNANGSKASVFVLDGDVVRARPVVVSDNDGTVARLARGLRRRRAGRAQPGRQPYGWRARATCGAAAVERARCGRPVTLVTALVLRDERHGAGAAAAQGAAAAVVDDAGRGDAARSGLPPELPRTEVVRFDAAVARALARNPTATVALDEIARARAVVEEVRAASLPILSANAGYTRLDHDRTLTGASGTQVISPADQVNANLLLTVPLVAPPRWVQWSQAKENVEVARMSAADVRRQLALVTARTYLEIIAQHHVVEVSQRARDSARAHYQFAHQRFAGGWGTRLDEVRAAQEVATDESQLQASVASLARLREALGVLMALDHPVDVTEDVALPGAPALERVAKGRVDPARRRAPVPRPAARGRARGAR